jgi:hypothetical protein
VTAELSIFASTDQGIAWLSSARRRR